MKEKYNLIKLEDNDPVEIIISDEIEKLEKLSVRLKTLRQNLLRLTTKMNPVYEKELQLWKQNSNNYKPTPFFHDLLNTYDEYGKEYRLLCEELTLLLSDEAREIDFSVKNNCQNPEKIKQLKYPPSYQKIFEAMLDDYRNQKKIVIEKKELELKEEISNYKESCLGSKEYMKCLSKRDAEGECRGDCCCSLGFFTCGLSWLIEATLKRIAEAIHKCTTNSLETQIESERNEQDKDISEWDKDFVLFKQMKESIKQDPRANLRYQFFKTAEIYYTSPLINQEQLNEPLFLNNPTKNF